MLSARHRPARPRARRLGALLGLVVAGLLGALTLGVTPASADPSPGAWTTLRTCESGGNYQVVARNGHYGAYQFDLGTWRSVGGTGRPDQATPAEQDLRALTLYRMRGWQPWTCARSQGLREDADARSGRTPTAAEAARVAGHALPGSGASGGTGTGGAVSTAPAWPGSPFYYGDCSPTIKAFQLQMNQRGYHYTFVGTGCYAGETRAAVKAVRLANGLTPRDRLDHATWTAAFSGVAAR